MTIDVSKLIAPTANTRFSKLRPAQEEVLNIYASEAHKLSDIAIELPTGAGKTLIALLILEYWRNQGSRVAVLTGNKTLARQLESEAIDLGVPTVRFEGRGEDFLPKDLRLYRRAQAIGIMNYWVYINQGPAVEAADYLVLDDAQLAEGALSSLYSAQVRRWEHGELFSELMRLIATYSDSPVADDFVKQIEVGPWRPTDLIPFPAMLEMWDEVEALLDIKLGTAPQNDPAWKNLSFRWGRIRHRARQTLMLVSPDEILFRPYIYPAQDYDLISASRQRIYMSATLHDPEDLRRRLGTPTIQKIEISANLSRAQDGRRLFIFNQTASPTSRAEPTDEVLVPLCELLKVGKKSVWLCSSKHEASRWKQWIQDELGQVTTWELTSTGDELDAFSAASEGHLFIGGRFEGMDFPDSSCRLAVLPSLPIATGQLERFVCEQLKDASFQRTRMLERIKQGIGRCTRGKSDYAVYYLLDTRFQAEMGSEDFGALVSERIRRQVEVGLELTQDGMGQVVPFASKFLRGDFSEFDKRENEARPPKVPSQEDLEVSRSISAEVNGWRVLFESRNLTNACDFFEKVSTELPGHEREHRAFWTYLQAFAYYLSFKLDDEQDALPKSLNLLKKAVSEGGSASWFNRLRKSYNKLSGEVDTTSQDSSHEKLFDYWDQLVETYPYQRGRFLRWQARLKEFLDGSHDQVCDFLQIFGQLLGFAASRPPGDGAPDGVWLSDNHGITIEAKIEVQRDSISLGDVNQADGHRRTLQASQQFGDDNTAAVIVTRMTKIDTIAEQAMGNIKVIPIELISELQSRLEWIMREYWKGWSRSDSSIRNSLRRAASQKLPPVGWMLRALKNARGPFLDEEDLFQEWPR